jgi:hypothetical protein
MRRVRSQKTKREESHVSALQRPQGRGANSARDTILASLIGTFELSSYAGDNATLLAGCGGAGLGGWSRPHRGSSVRQGEVFSLQRAAGRRGLCKRSTRGLRDTCSVALASGFTDLGSWRSVALADVPGLLEATSDNVPRNKAEMLVALAALPQLPVVLLFVLRPINGKVSNEDIQSVMSVCTFLQVEPSAVIISVNGVDEEEVEDAAKYRKSLDESLTALLGGQTLRLILLPLVPGASSNARSDVARIRAELRRAIAECPTHRFAVNPNSNLISLADDSAELVQQKLAAEEQAARAKREREAFERRTQRERLQRLRGFTDEFTDKQGWNEEKHYATMWPVVVGRRLYLLGRGCAATFGRWLNLDDNSGGSMPSGPALTDSAGWGNPQYYSTWDVVVLGDRFITVCCRGAGGVAVLAFDTAKYTWVALPTLQAYTDTEGWNLEDSLLRHATLRGMQAPPRRRG